MSPTPTSATHPPPRAPSPSSPLPTHTYHASSLLPRSIPTPALLDSVAGGAHYSGVDFANGRRRSLRAHTLSMHGAPSPGHRGEFGVAARRQSTVPPLVPSALHRVAMGELKELYEGRATKQLMQDRWGKDSVYEDSFTRCKGISEIAPQWYALPRMYSKLAITGQRVLSSTESPNRLIMWQKHEYTVRVTGAKKVVESILVIDFDETGKIVRMVDQRAGAEPPTHWGAHHLRRLNGYVVPWVPWLGSAPPKPKPNHH
ncbi:hypothetical protein BC834DRAFT_828139 [Gloeopeniophorella convolvens]|nr:hypothetical protein BC834DRAFT_828139 [Gloeopeniophorella convolvens]